MSVVDYTPWGKTAGVNPWYGVCRWDGYLLSWKLALEGPLHEVADRAHGVFSLV